MIEIKLNTNVENTRDFQRLVRQKAREGVMLFVRNEFDANRIKINGEIIKESDEYKKDAKLLIKGIRVDNV